MAFPQPAFSQDSLTTALKQEVSHATSDSAKMTLLYQLTYAYLNSSLDSALIYAKQCVQVAQGTSFKKLVCNCNAVLGTVHMYSNNYDSAQYFYDVALQAARRYEQPDRISAMYSNFGVLYKRQELYDQAAQSYLEGLEVDEQTNNDYGIVIKKINLANLYSTISDDAKALQFAEEALETCEKMDHSDKEYIQAFILNNIGAIWVEQGEFEKALEKFNAALAVNRELQNANEIARNLHNIGATLEKLGRTEQGLPSSIEALQIRREIGDAVGLIETEMQLGTAYAKLGNQKDSDGHFQSALSLAEPLSNHTLLSELYLAMSNASELLEKTDMALLYYKNHHRHADSIDAQYDREAYLELETKYEAAQKDATIVRQNLLIAQQLSTRNKYLLGFALLLGAIAFLWYRNAKNKSLNQERLHNLKQEHKLAVVNHVVEGQELERTRIARDLHDGLGGLLSSIKMKMEGRSKNGVGEQEDLLSKASEMIDEACIEVRRISHDMMPGALTQLGLFQAVEDLVEEIQANHGVEISLHYDDGSLSDQQSIHLYRVIQEILNNALKYSGASEMEVQFQSMEDQLQLMISDNGSGFDLNAARQKAGIGLKNIEARIAYLSGQLKIITRDQEGCTYLIRIPQKA